MIELIKQSCMEDSNISAMRVLNYIALCSILVPYVIANITQTIVCAVSQKPIAFIDIPVAAAGVVTACITMKAVQSYAERGK